ncbi:hypothetical protein HMPREF9194_00999 [Treponema maltophilum ATCC 51939]|uniref:Uncharacterized protein n=1 Tax=Treponema maltophilum ATCC 51939 TaxID=1125699 RepID=S3JZM1_TREMA|nr:hypothetical protein HMPREF9194_00999 [Treponema maltophilum ATCC 51939]
MRNIEKYGNDYNTKNDFETVQVLYRRKKVLECLHNAAPPPPDKYWKSGAVWNRFFYSIKIFQNISSPNRVPCFLKMHNIWQKKTI